MVKNTMQMDILKLLVENNDTSFSINEISKILKKDYKNTHNSIQTLPSIKMEKLGGANHISFDFTFSELLFLVENQRRNECLKDKNIYVVYEDLRKINTQFILLLFGSRAKKTNHKNSDYDLLLITDSKEFIENRLNLYPLDIDLNIFNLNEFKEMLLSKEFTVVSEAVKNNIILFGIEDYYRLIENAK